MRLAYDTPIFGVSDPLVCHSIRLRPSEWAVVFDLLEKLGYDWSWRQADPSAATPAEVAAEFISATDNAIWSGCSMIGQIIELAIDAPPAWLLRCDGATYANVDYPDLAAVIHPGLVVDGDHFRVPDRDNRFGIDGVYVGTQGGEAEHTLTAAEMPQHNHTEVTATAALINGGLEAPAASAVPGAGLTGDAGSGDPHNNMPPYEGTAFYIIAAYPTA